MQLTKKIILIWSLVLIFCLLLQSILVIAIVRQNTEETIRSELGTSLEQYISNTLSARQNVLEEYKLDSVQSYVREYQNSALEVAGQIASYTHVQYLIYNLSGDLLLNTGTADEQFETRVWDSISTLVNQSFSTDFLHDTLQPGVFIAGKEFMPWEWIIVTTDQNKHPTSQIWQIIGGTILLLGVILIITIIVMMLISQRLIIKPIKTLHKTSQTITKGIYPESIDIHSRDIFGELARAMEVMSGRLKKNQNDLINLNISLELKVTEKTEELERKSRALAEENRKHKDLENQYRSIFDYSPNAIFINLNNRIFLANNTCGQLFGAVSPDQLTGRNIYDCFDPEFHDIIAEQISTMRSEGTPVPQIEQRIIRLDGTAVDVEVIATPFQLHGKQAIHVIIRDITEQKILQKEKDLFQQKLVENQKMELISQIAGGVAHDFNNMLSGILGNIELAKMEAPSNSPIHSYLQRAFSAYERAKNLATQLLTLSKSHSIKTAPTDIKQLLIDNVKFTLTGTDIPVKYDIDDHLWLCDVDVNQLSLVVDNLVINAKQALGKNGTIWIAAENTTLKLRNPYQLEKGDYAHIAITDNGSGIPRKIKSHIFDPFYTTKSTGTGLGLSTSLSILTKHRGSITLDSTGDTGTTFSIFLPRSSTETVKKIPIEEKLFSGQGKILILDDEDIVRSVLSSMLFSLGYEVIEVSDGQEVLDMCHTQKTDKELTEGLSSLQAAFFDLTIPGGIGGREVINKLQDRCKKDIPIIAISGYSDDDVITDPTKYGFTASVQKPFKRGDLIRILSTYCN